MSSSPSPAPTRPLKPARFGRPTSDFTPLYLLLAAILVLWIGIGRLLAQPVGRWMAAAQPTASPTQTALPTPTLSPTPTRRPRLATPTPTPQSQSTRAEPVLRNSLNTIKMLDAQRGWGHGNGTLWRTEDGGERWENVTPPEFDFRQAVATGWTSPFFLNDQAAWFFTINFVSQEPARLYRTGDGGKTWGWYPAPFGMARMFFLDTDTGWALTNNHDQGAIHLYATQDGGANWTLTHQAPSEDLDESLALPASVNLSAPVFRSVAQGWIAGINSGAGRLAPFYKTQDGGKTWSLVDLGLNRQYPVHDYYIVPPRFFGPDALEGVLPVYVTESSLPPVWQWVFFFTQDGGQSWQPSQPFEVKSDRAKAQVLSTDEIYILDGDRLFTSTDGAVSWQPVETNIKDVRITSEHLVEIHQFSFVSQRLGWAWGMDVSGQMRLFRTQDGGKRWQWIRIEP